MNVSKFLGKVLGIYLLIVSISMIINMDQFANYIKELINDPPLMFITGFFTLILGLLMVVSHNIWKWSWQLIITLIAWLSLLKGVSLIFYPAYIDHISMLFIQNSSFAYTATGIDFILGVILTYFGFRKK